VFCYVPSYEDGVYAKASSEFLIVRIAAKDYTLQKYGMPFNESI
jgi:hypothetical protein